MTKIYSTKEMINKLLENPEKKFVSDENTDNEMIAHIERGCLFIEDTKRGMTSVAINREWREIKKPVKFNEVLEFIYKNNDNCVDITFVYNDIVFRRDSLDSILLKLIKEFTPIGIASAILKGKWYISEG